jgi:hypothetical protein
MEYFPLPCPETVRGPPISYPPGTR